MLRRSLLAAVLCLLVAGALGRAAHAAPAVPPPPQRPAQPQLYTTAHFAIHYDAQIKAADYMNQVQASTLGAYLEQGYATITSLGFAPPVDDSVETPGKIDYYVVDLSQQAIAYAVFPDGVSAPTSGSVTWGISEIDAANESWEAIATLFDIFEYRWWTGGENWAAEGPSHWLAFKALGYPGISATDLGPVGGSLDCSDAFTVGNPQQHCSKSLYENQGASHWTFWEYLGDRFGPTFVVSMFQQQNASGGPSLPALQAALAANGTSLDDAFHDWAVKVMTGGWGIPALDAAQTPLAATVVTGTATANLGSQTFSVDHLSARYIAFTRGDGAGDHPCFAATLTVTVTYPAGINARPVFYWNGPGGTPVVLTSTGPTTASATVPWDTCFWSQNKAFLALINTSTDQNIAQYTVSTSLAVDPKTPASATAAPAGQSGGSVYGGVTAVPTSDLAPSIDVFGPLLLQVSTQSPVLRLIVASTADGTVHAQLGSVDLGSPAVRAGNNDLRFTLPQSVLTSLRRSSAAADVLTLTPVSPSGAVTGAAVTRQVAVAAATKPKTTKPKATKPKPRKK